MRSGVTGAELGSVIFLYIAYLENGEQQWKHNRAESTPGINFYGDSLNVDAGTLAPFRQADSSLPERRDPPPPESLSSQCAHLAYAPHESIRAPAAEARPTW